MSVVGTALATAVLPYEAARGQRRRSWQEWRSFWTTSPRIPPDEVHGRAFTGWLFLAYPLMVGVVVLFAWVDDVTRYEPPPWVFVGLVAFALMSGAFHWRRSTADLPTVTRRAQVLAGWPAEAVLLAVSLGGAWVTIGA
ncbi:hypothetical protein [Cellulomonas aerilata]|uniref:Uncharacterized protein n=1 Tax=Cellulomonas aerilata TaxID=515326 RepID=A0A512D9K6_9CELL|nr:hypothetical protein [Cellulomonas aerilata]GEO33166.1 hypothetical protein CAE01nite_08910 [Cellulomonas aerilata]